mgnify:CR=1 FL=1
MQNNNNFTQGFLLVLVIIMMIVGYKIGYDNGFKKATSQICYLADYKTDFCQSYLRDFVLPEATSN